MFKTKLARETWETKYKFGDETPLQTFERVARALATVEKNPEEWYERFLHTLVRFDDQGNAIGLKCTTGGRITANIGTSFKKATLLNCFISSPVSNAHVKYTKSTENGLLKFPVEYSSSDNPDDLINIFLTIVEQARTLASEGGYGLNFDFIRPRGSLIKGTGISHPGVIAYMKIWDSVSQCIVQGNTDGYADKIKNHFSEEKFNEVKGIVKNAIRKGAMLASLSCSHPDCEEFIRAKQTSGVLTKFNMSVVLTNDFMQAVENDDFFDQTFNDKVIKRIKARELYDLIMQSCYNRAEPGVLFSDNMMKNNPMAFLGKPKVTNPCVSPETRVLTDKGEFKIEDLSGQLIKVWNGKEFSEVFVKKTGINQDLSRIVFSNGAILDCTGYHKFFVVRNEKIIEIQTDSIEIGDCLEPFDLPDGSHIQISVIGAARGYRKSDVYCFIEHKRGRGTFNNIVTAQCGEIPGLSSIGSVCLLGSLNLPQYIKINSLKEVSFDFDEYSEDIKIFMRMLDNVNDLTFTPLPAYQWLVDNLRQVGMGINGLGSALMMMGIRYDSPEAVDFTKKICQIKENLTWQVSALLAKEKGTFKVYDKEKFEATEYFNSDRITDKTRDMLRKYGARNSKTTTAPPLGNSSLLSDITSNGIEPVYLLEYERKVICQEWPAGLDIENVKTILKHHKKKDFEYWRGSYEGKEYYFEPQNRGLCEINTVRDYGYQWLLDNFPDRNHDKYINTSKDLKIDDHLAIQAVAQHYNNQSCSKTCTLPNKYPFEDFKDLYLKAWKLELNGFTTYREGSMESVLSGFDEKREVIAKDIKLPEVFLNGPTHIIKKEGKKFYLHFSYLPEDIKMEYPICIWIYTNAKYKPDELRVCNKAARNLAQLALSCGIDRKIIDETIGKAKEDYPHNRLGRMVSLGLRHNIPREDILVALMGIDGDNVSTLLTAVRKFLSKTLEDGTQLKGAKCPACKGGRIVMESNCMRCLDCPYTGC